MHDDYELFKADGKCVLDSSLENGQVLIRLVDDESLGRELRTYKKTETYLKTKNDGTLPETTKRILRDAAEENRQRRQRLTTLLKTARRRGRLLRRRAAAHDQVPGTLRRHREGPGVPDREHVHEDELHQGAEPVAEKEIQAILRSNDIGQQTLKLTIDEGNPEAIDELRNYIDLCTKTSKQIVLHDMIEVRFSNRPYGWPDMEVALLLARLLVLGEISLVMDGGVIPLDKCYDALTTPAKWRKIVVTQRQTHKPEEIKKARMLGQDVFSEMGPDGEDALFTFLKGKLQGWQTALLGYKPLAETGDYPGLEEIKSGLTLTKKLLADEDSFKFIEHFNANKDDLKDLSDDFHDLEHFYEHQKPTWDALRKACGRFQPNRSELEHDPTAGPAWKRMGEILKAPAPYGMLHEVDGLIRTVEAVNTSLVSERRGEALAKIDNFLTIVGQELDVIDAESALRAACTGPLQKLRSQVGAEESLAHITQAKQDAQQAYDAAVTRIEEASKSSKLVLGGNGPGSNRWNHGYRREVSPGDRARQACRQALPGDPARRGGFLVHLEAEPRRRPRQERTHRDPLRAARRMNRNKIKDLRSASSPGLHPGGDGSCGLLRADGREDRAGRRAGRRGGDRRPDRIPVPWRRSGSGCEERIDHEGFEHVMEAMAYTWFNRLVAIRFMELHGYLDHGYRVLEPSRRPDHARNPRTRRARRSAGPEAGDGHRPEAGGEPGGRALPACC